MADSTSSSEQLSERQSETTRRRRLGPTDASEAVGKQVNGFVNFLRENAVLALAIGFVFGTQVQTIVKQFVDGFITPLIQFIFPGQKQLSDQTFLLHWGSHAARFHWGAMTDDLIDFLFVAAVVYAVVRLFRLDRLKKT